VLREVAPRVDGWRVHAASVEDERRDADQWQHIPHVHIDVHSHVLGHASGAHAQAEYAEEGRALVLGSLRIEPVDHVLVMEGRIGPAAVEFLDSLFRLAARRKPGEVRSSDETRCRVQEDQARAALGIRGGEEHAKRAGIAQGEEHRTLRTGRFQDRADVVHSRLKRVGAGKAVGHAGSALVEDDQARHRSEALEQPRVCWALPRELDMVRHVRDPDEIGRSVAHHLEGDRNVAALGVLRLGLHRRSLAPRRGER
jgi:hypothetical protein